MNVQQVAPAQRRGGGGNLQQVPQSLGAGPLSGGAVRAGPGFPPTSSLQHLTSNESFILPLKSTSNQIKFEF